MNTAVVVAALTLVQAIIAPGYGLRITAPAPQGLRQGFYGAADEYNAGYVYSVWYTDCGDEIMVVVDGLGAFEAEYDRSVVPTLPA